MTWFLTMRSLHLDYGTAPYSLIWLPQLLCLLHNGMNLRLILQHRHTRNLCAPACGFLMVLVMTETVIHKLLAKLRKQMLSNETQL